MSVTIFLASASSDVFAMLEWGGIKYFTKMTSDADPLPFGYEKLDVVSDNDDMNRRYEVYENKYALPTGYTYDTFGDIEKWNSYSPVEKQASLLKTASIEDYDGEIACGPNDISDVVDLEYSVKCNDGVVQVGNNFIVALKNASVELEFEGICGVRNIPASV